MSILGDIKYNLLKNFCYILNLIESPLSWKPDQMTMEDTLDYIIKNKVSISRFGDGEYKWMFGEKQNSFQEQTDALKNDLIDAYHCRDGRLLICLSDCFQNLAQYKSDAKKFWAVFMIEHREKIRRISMSDYKYGNLAVTRFYIDYNSSSHVPSIINKWKKVWDKRDLVIIEGEFTRLGVGNDLFSTSNSVKRIIAPAQNAYSKLDDIFEYVSNEIDKDVLLLLALGPTATVLSAKLTQIGYQALDVGHIDIEYEWYLQGAKSKIPVKNKYVNEASNIGGTNVLDMVDLEKKNEYMNQIIKRIL